MNNTLLEEVLGVINHCAPDKTFLLADSNVARLESDLIETLRAATSGSLIVIEAGEESKSVETLLSILTELSRGGATRRSLLLCIGGGMTTDIGGFAAAIFKRGIRHMNIATTLLAAVDAAVGGKTGIDFLGIKNDVGAFHQPVASLFDAESFATLPPQEILSGFGEVVKTALISSAEMTRRIYSIAPLEADAAALGEVCAFCRDEKMRVVAADPEERGLRKVLNMGHTAGHAFEALSYEREAARSSSGEKTSQSFLEDKAPESSLKDKIPNSSLEDKDTKYSLEGGAGMPHGVAIAHGNLVALILSNMLLGLDSAEVSAYAAWLRANYPDSGITCKDYPRLWEIAVHDKKNAGGAVLRYTLVAPIGEAHYDVEVTRAQFEEALDIYQELLGR